MTYWTKELQEFSVLMWYIPVGNCRAVLYQIVVKLSFCCLWSWVEYQRPNKHHGGVRWFTPAPQVIRAHKNCIDIELGSSQTPGELVMGVGVRKDWFLIDSFCLLLHFFSVIRSFAQSIFRSFVCSIIRSFTHSFIHSFIHSIIRSFIK